MNCVHVLITDKVDLIRDKLSVLTTEILKLAVLLTRAVVVTAGSVGELKETVKRRKEVLVTDLTFQRFIGEGESEDVEKISQDVREMKVMKDFKATYFGSRKSSKIGV